MSEDSQSILYLYRSLLQLRKEEQVLITGTYRSLDTNNPHCLVYERENEKNNMRIYLNFSSTNQRIPVKNCQDFDLELTTYLDGNCTLDDDRLILRADEGVILKKIGQGDAREGSKEKPSSDI